jgi:hypothetical protein
MLRSIYVKVVSMLRSYLCYGRIYVTVVSMLRSIYVKVDRVTGNKLFFAKA